LSLIVSVSDAENFVDHPVKAYDPWYTRDIQMFKDTWEDFETFLRELVASNPTSKVINYANSLYYEAIYKCRVYEKATGISLISLHVPGSPLSSLYDCL